MGTPRRKRSRRGRPWDEDSIREALTEFLAGKTRWPTYQEFAKAGLKGLRDVLPRFGGPERWALEMNLQEGPRAWGGVVRWTDDAIRQALSDLLPGRTSWPTHREFRRAGLGGLYAKLLQEGTLKQWATEFGLPPPPPQRARRRPPVKTTATNPIPRGRRWTDDRIAEELTRFLENTSSWPAYSEFVSAGRLRLYQAVINHGGTRQWAERMNVQCNARRRSW